MPPALAVEIVLTLNVTPAVLEVARVLVGGSGMTEADVRAVVDRLTKDARTLRDTAEPS
jgi:hypothetical protein